MENKSQFAELLTDVMALYGKEANKGTMRIWWELLNGYSFEQISHAFGQHAQADKFAPVPAAILSLLPSVGGHIEPNEAWAALPKAETDGGYVTNEIMAGMGAALDLIIAGDMVAARMAFIERYKRAVMESNSRGEKAKYFYSAPSIGTHEQKQQIKAAALLNAKDRKWITNQKFNESNNRLDQPTSQNNPVLAMLNLPQESGLQKIGKKSNEPTDDLS